MSALDTDFGMKLYQALLQKLNVTKTIYNPLVLEGYFRDLPEWPSCERCGRMCGELRPNKRNGPSHYFRTCGACAPGQFVQSILRRPS